MRPAGFHIAALLLPLALVGAGSAAVEGQVPRPAVSPLPARPESLLVFLRHWVYTGPWQDWLDGPDSTTWYQAAAFPPGPRYSEAYIVQLKGRPWCGMNVGCETLVIGRDSTGYQVLGDFDRVHIPVSVLRTSQYGWPDLTTWAWGAGRLTPRLGLMRFDGKAYRGDPAEGPRAQHEGRRILTDSTRPQPLFPATPRWP